MPSKIYSRQGFLPLLGSYIDKAHVKTKTMLGSTSLKQLTEVTRTSKPPADCKKFSELPNENPFAQVITALIIIIINIFMQDNHFSYKKTAINMGPA